MSENTRDMPLLREELFDGEDSYFKGRPDVAGMAAEDGSVVLNPYSPLNADQKYAVYMNEAARLYMRKNGTPTFDLTESQSNYLNGNDYKSASDDDRRATVIARILSGDSSISDPTDEQRFIAADIGKKMQKEAFHRAWNKEVEAQ